MDLIGKGGHIRMVPIPHWAKQALEKCLRSPRARRDGKTRRNAAPNRRVRGFGTLRDTKTDSGPATGINQLIHFKRDMFGRPGRNRTCNPRIRNPMLYPLELRALEYFSLRVRRSHFLTSALTGAASIGEAVGSNEVGANIGSLCFRDVS